MKDLMPKILVLRSRTPENQTGKSMGIGFFFLYNLKLSYNLSYNDPVVGSLDPTSHVVTLSGSLLELIWRKEAIVQQW